MNTLRIKYSVVVAHKYARELNGRFIFRVSSTYDERFPNNEGWFADARPFGCSKTYINPRAAIEGMVADHAGTVVSVEPLGTY